MRPRPALALLAVALLATTPTAAQPPPAVPPAAVPKAAASSAPVAPGTKEVRRDPEGKRGISPYTELIAKGEASFVARDLAGAVAAFQDAIKLDIDKMLGFVRLGEAQLELGKLDEAEIAWQTALNKKGTDDLSARVLFMTADLRERQKKWQPAKDAWSAYTAFLQSHAKVAGFPAVAIERQKVIDKRMKDEVDYGAVKARIAKRIAEQEKEALENAKKDKLNR